MAATVSRSKVATRAPRKVTVRPAHLKTVVTDASVAEYLASVSDADQRRDVAVIATMFRAVTKLPPRMWGGSIVGYGSSAKALMTHAFKRAKALAPTMAKGAKD